MAQTYRTIYHSDYRDKLGNTKKFKPKEDRFTTMLPPFGNWLVIKSLAEQVQSKSSMKAAEHKVKEMYSNRCSSVYQVDYGHTLRKKQTECGNRANQGNIENELLNSCRRQLGIKTMPVFPPRPSARKLFGFISPKLTYTGHTVYQDYHDSLACEILEKGKDANLNIC